MHPRHVLTACAAVIIAVSVAGAVRDTLAQTRPASGYNLLPVSSFATIADPRERSVALFQEAGKVITHPRCMNCHPATDRPMQTDRMQPHQPLVLRGADEHGAPGMKCNTCHQVSNFEPSRVPGHPKWHVAPASMAWQGKSLGAICEQIKDVSRNGNQSMAALVIHMAEDTLVGWAWNPGADRTPPPGTQAEFGQLIKAWAETGAHCPPVEPTSRQ